MVKVSKSDISITHISYFLFNSLRAKFGSEKYMNAVHGSDSQDTAARELAFFFPDFVAPTVEGKPKLQRTLALIRPDAYKNSKGKVKPFYSIGLSRNTTIFFIYYIVLKFSLSLYSWDTHFDTSTTDCVEIIVGKGEIACIEQFLLFPQCFLLNQIIVSPFVRIFDIISLFAAELEEPKIGISDIGLNTIL